MSAALALDSPGNRPAARRHEPTRLTITPEEATCRLKQFTEEETRRVNAVLIYGSPSAAARKLNCCRQAVSSTFKRYCQLYAVLVEDTLSTPIIPHVIRQPRPKQL